MIDLDVSAAFSDDGVYRWLLRRWVGVLGGPVLVSCGYNPSVAGFVKNDPTARRLISFAEDLGCSELLQFNVMAAVATDPNDLASMDDPVGALNDEYLRAGIDLALRTDGILLATWGTPKGKAATKRIAQRRMETVLAMAPWQALRVTKSGYPEHPLYLPKGLKPSLIKTTGIAA